MEARRNPNRVPDQEQLVDIANRVESLCQQLHAFLEMLPATTPHAVRHHHQEEAEAEDEEEAGAGPAIDAEEEQEEPLADLRLIDIVAGESQRDALCSVCLEEFRVGAYLSLLQPCNHVFHTHCILRWATGSRSCPLCRSAF